MGRGAPLFGGKSKKYKKVILAVFPKDPTEDIQNHNVGKLVHFCELTPQKLPKVSLYLEKRVDADLAKSRLGYVEVSMKIFNELIKGCRKHLPLFTTSILKLIKLLLEKNEHPELKIIATETFIKFAEVHDETAQYSDLEMFVGYFMGMCNNNIGHENMRRRLRIQGLRGLRAYIGMLDVVDELDSFVSRQSSTNTFFFPTLLENMQYSDFSLSEAPQGQNEEGQTTAANVKALATDVLRDLATRVNNIAVTSLTSAVLTYLDAQDKWIPNTFAVECLQTISYSLNSQHNQIMMARVLQHLEINHSTRVTQQIVSTIVSIVSESTGPVVSVLSSLMKLLVSTIQEAAQTPPVAHVEEQLMLQQILIDCVGAVSKKFPSAAQKVEAMGFILSLYEEGASRIHAGGFTLALVLAECVLAVGGHLVYLPSDCVSGHLFSTLLELVVHSDPTVRVYAHRIIHCLLLPGRSLGQLAAIPPGDMSSIMGSGCDDLMTKQGAVLRDSLLAAAIMRTNQPENYATVFHTMTIMMYRSRDKEIQYSIPLAFKMQKRFQKRKRAPALQARSLHTLVAAYLLLVSRMYACKPLEQYVMEVIDQRAEQGQLCRYLELKTDGMTSLIVKTKKYSESAKHRSVNIFFDRLRVVAALVTVPALQQEYSHLEKILSRSYRTRDKLKNEVSIASVLYLPTNGGMPPLTTTPRTAASSSDTLRVSADQQPPASLDNPKKLKVTQSEWSLIHNTLDDSQQVKIKAVSADGLRKVLEGHDHIVQADGVTLLLAAEHFGPAASRCADTAIEKAMVYSRIMSLALERDKDKDKDKENNDRLNSNGSSSNNDKLNSSSNHDHNHDMNGKDNSDMDTLDTISDLSALRLDLLGPLRPFCD